MSASCWRRLTMLHDCAELVRSWQNKKLVRLLGRLREVLIVLCELVQSQTSNVSGAETKEIARYLK